MLDQFPPRCAISSSATRSRKPPSPTIPPFVRAPLVDGAVEPNCSRRSGSRRDHPAGFTVEVDNSCDDWDYARAADYLLGRLRELRQKSARVCLISGGEVTVKVTNGGIGGRNQQFALACAQKIAGENITVLSAGTDGIDGNSTAAGAVVDGTTAERAKAAGL